MLKKLLRGIPLLLPFGLIACGYQSQPKENTSGNGNDTHNGIAIVSIHDGDTLTLSTNEEIRLFGVDTPELSNYSHNHWVNTTGIEYQWGIKARDYVRAHYLNEYVNINYEKQDPYGRSIARVELNHNDLASELLKVGLARVGYISSSKGNKYYSSDIAYYNHLKLLERQAKGNHIGIWAQDVSLIYQSKPHITN